MPEIVMPRLSDSMEEGTILSWLKEVGDEVAVGEEIAEIETDKANMAYESDTAGTLTEIIVAEGETVPIGAPIARIGEKGEVVERDEGAGSNGEAKDGEGSASPAAGPVAEDSPPARPREGQSSTPPAGDEEEGSSAADAPADSAAAPAGDGGERVKASPLARRLAKERGLNLGAVSGSGPGGRIVKADVEGAQAPAAEAPAAAPPQGQPSTPPAGEAGETAKGQTSYEELSRLQEVIARRMAESKATAPHFYLRAVVDMSRAVEARGRLKAGASEGEVVPSFNDMVVKACALALKEHPRANGAYRDGRYELYSRVNVGVAVAAQDALVVPTVFDADRKGLRQIASDARELAGRVRDGKITPPELSGATFTVSNLGMYGIEGFSAVINPPQAAILAVGAIAEEPVVREGEITTAHLMRVDLACDHRILYGADAAEFLARIVALLEEPVSLAL